MKSILLYISLSLCAMLCTAQQYPDRHSTSYTDAWLSCTPSSNPNTDRGESHWIRYDLGATYVLSTITLWNYNDPNNLENGVQEIAIDISSDGINWTEAGTATVAISEGSSYYEGIDVMDLGGVSTDYLLITVLSNHGGTCTGFSEMKVASAVVLPIELSKQEAICTDNDGVIIAWRTVSEVENDYFTIQKSDNAIDWFDLTEFPAKGTNGLGAEYYLLDKEITGVHYYRLVNTDLDGQRQYFDIMTANCDGPSIMSMSVANPFTESLVINYNPLSVGSEIVYTVESIDGSQVFRKVTNGQSNSITIPSTEWTSGTYIFTILQNGQRITEKVVKI